MHFASIKPCIIFFITFSYLQFLFSAQEKSSRTINYPKFTRKPPVYSSVSLKRSTFSFFLKLMFSWTLVIDEKNKKTRHLGGHRHSPGTGISLSQRSGFRNRLREKRRERKTLSQMKKATNIYPSWTQRKSSISLSC